MTPIRKLISALVALWLRDNPTAMEERWKVDENGEAVDVIIRRVRPEYVMFPNVTKTDVPVYSEN